MVIAPTLSMPTRESALRGRATPLVVSDRHYVLGTPMRGAIEGTESILFGMGCFWGAEKAFWSLPGVKATMVGYAGGFTENATYEEVCSGQTGHTEVVRVVFAPAEVSLDALLRVFWEGHDPTQGMRQGPDIGTQYRSAIFATTDAQLERAQASRVAYEEALRRAGHAPITTEIDRAPAFYYAEDYHQQYLAKNPDGYCGHGGTGVACPIGTGVTAR